MMYKYFLTVLSILLYGFLVLVCANSQIQDRYNSETMVKRLKNKNSVEAVPSLLYFQTKQSSTSLDHQRRQIKKRHAKENSREETNDLENLIGTSLQTCLNCICFASIHWSKSERQICDSRFITETYWKTAGSPSLNETMDGREAYEACMNNENCFLNTIKQYTEAFGQKDCNENGEFDCVDRFYLQSYNRDCVIIPYTPYFYDCISHLSQ